MVEKSFDAEQHGVHSTAEPQGKNGIYTKTELQGEISRYRLAKLLQIMFEKGKKIKRIKKIKKKIGRFESDMEKQTHKTLEIQKLLEERKNYNSKLERTDGMFDD